ncbi:hypothetical protein N7493_007268 [Penicillium malachiteum]|uniref:Uncharacterized protein n=1 Tax=Penicillium malachiteum TaxID=1324776 RepID=A0AAD6HJ47_9EURO|nr:hypothetical protein N7493_007268 [Penicillium malachiteum]
MLSWLFNHWLQLPFLLNASVYLKYGFCMPQTHKQNIGHVKSCSHLELGPIDAVYTWVNGSDPEWKAERDFWYRCWLQDSDGARQNLNNVPSMSDKNDDGASDDNHYRDNDELRYSIRSLEKYAPWIHKIYIVTNGQVPSWLNREDLRVKIVTHSEIFENSSHLPVFSSSAIESHLDRIPGLSDYFLYFNDDIFLGAPVEPDDFIGPSGEQKIYLSHPVPLGNDAYPEYWSQGKVGRGNDHDSTQGLPTSFLDTGRVETAPEALVGKIFLSSACDSGEVRTEILQYLLGHILSDSPSHSDGQIGSALKLLQPAQDPRLSDHNPSNSAEEESNLELDTKTRIKIAALLDAFSQCPNDHDLVSEAIRSVIKTFNERFNLSKHLRRVPAHMPHMIKKQTLIELKDIFSHEFQQNSLHKFRHPRDLQVSFAYFDYLINRPYFLSTLYGLDKGKCDLNHTDLHPGECYELKMDTDVTFHMLGDDYQTTMHKLNFTREHPTKFICLNDDMKNQSLELRFALHDLLESLWPVPSTFEFDATPFKPKTPMQELQVQLQSSSLSTSFLTFASMGTVIVYLLLRRWIKVI